VKRNVVDNAHAAYGAEVDALSEFEVEELTVIAPTCNTPWWATSTPSVTALQASRDAVDREFDALVQLMRAMADELGQVPAAITAHTFEPVLPKADLRRLVRRLRRRTAQARDDGGADAEEPPQASCLGGGVPSACRRPTGRIGHNNFGGASRGGSP